MKSRLAITQVMHQQYTETLTLGLEAVPGPGLLLAAAQDAKRGTPCVTMHSLAPEGVDVLPYTGRLPLPPIGAAPAASIPASQPPQVLSTAILRCVASL